MTKEFTIEAITAAIANVAKSQAKTAKDIGAALLGVLYAANVLDTAAPANALVAALRKSTKQSAILALLQTYGNLAWMATAKTPRFEIFDAGHAAAEWAECAHELRKICADWETFKVEKTPDQVDLVAKVEALLKKVASEEKAGRTVLHADLAKSLGDALAAYTSKAALI